MGNSSNKTAVQLNALVVDDDIIACKALAFALGQENFRCAMADDGGQALRMASREHFDLVVTDLRMPVTHGHALAIELLALPNPPVVVIHSSIDDPRLTREMMLRGVDDFIYKPTNYFSFAAKIRVTVERRIAEKPRTQPAAPPSPSANAGKLNRPTVSSSAAVDAFFISTMDDSNENNLVLTVQKDPRLAAEVLREANSPEHTAGSHVTVDLREAVRRIGFRKVSDMALEQLHGTPGGAG